MVYAGLRFAASGPRSPHAAQRNAGIFPGRQTRIALRCIRATLAGRARPEGAPDLAATRHVLRQAGTLGRTVADQVALQSPPSPQVRKSSAVRCTLAGIHLRYQHNIYQY